MYLWNWSFSPLKVKNCGGGGGGEERKKEELGSLGIYQIKSNSIVQDAMHLVRFIFWPYLLSLKITFNNFIAVIQ